MPMRVGVGVVKGGYYPEFLAPSRGGVIRDGEWYRQGRVMYA